MSNKVTTRLLSAILVMLTGCSATHGVFEEESICKASIEFECECNCNEENLLQKSPNAAVVTSIIE